MGFDKSKKCFQELDSLKEVFAAFIRFERDARGFTNKDMASKVQVSDATIGNILCCRYCSDLDTMLKILHYLSLDLRDFQEFIYEYSINERFRKKMEKLSLEDREAILENEVQ